MAKLEKVFVTMPKDLSWIPRTHTVEGQEPTPASCPLISIPSVVSVYIHTSVFFFFLFCCFEKGPHYDRNIVILTQIFTFQLNMKHCNTYLKDQGNREYFNLLS